METLTNTERATLTTAQAAVLVAIRNGSTLTPYPMGALSAALAPLPEQAINDALDALLDLGLITEPVLGLFVAT